MIEANALLAMFTVQILAMSVLHPVWFIRYVRVQVMNIPAERFAQLYPSYPVVDRSLTLERYLAWYRVLNLGIAVLGLWLLGWLFTNTQRPDWNVGPVKDWIMVYFFAQVSPLLLAAWGGVRHNQLLETLLEGKRKAVLQRRELFDFVSPFTVFLAIFVYLLFVAQLAYEKQNPLGHIAWITLIYAIEAFIVYRLLNSRKVNPYETHAARMHAIGAGVKVCVYSCIALGVHKSLTFTLVLLEMQRWEPFALSVYMLTTALLCFMGLTAPPRRPEADALGESPVT